MSEAAPEGEAAPCLYLSACTWSQRGAFSDMERGAEPRDLAVTWDSQRLCLAPAAALSSPIAVLDWHHVTSIWVSLRTRAREGFRLELALETRRSSVDFLCFSVAMNETSGQLLDFLQTEKNSRLKDGRAPRWVLSRWAGWLYRNGASSNRLRVGLGWCTTTIEILFAAGFFTQLQDIVLYRENKLMKAVGEMLNDFSRFGGLTLLAMLLQHVLMFWVVLQSCYSTVTSVWRSLQTFLHAGKKVHKSAKKLSTQARLGAAPRSADSEPGGDGPRQRKGAT